MSANPNETLRLPARREDIDAFRRRVLDAAAKAGLGWEAMDRLNLVLEEVLTDSASRRNSEPRPKAELTYAVVGPERLVLTFRDWGPPFDPERSVSAARAPRGLGLLLLRTLSDAESRRDGDSNLLTLRFGPKSDAGAPF